MEALAFAVGMRFKETYEGKHYLKSEELKYLIFQYISFSKSIVKSAGLSIFIQISVKRVGEVIQKGFLE